MAPTKVNAQRKKSASQAKAKDAEEASDTPRKSGGSSRRLTAAGFEVKESAASSPSADNSTSVASQESTASESPVGRQAERSSQSPVSRTSSQSPVKADIDPIVRQVRTALQASITKILKAPEDDKEAASAAYGIFQRIVSRLSELPPDIFNGILSDLDDTKRVLEFLRKMAKDKQMTSKVKATLDILLKNPGWQDAWQSSADSMKPQPEDKKKATHPLDPLAEKTPEAETPAKLGLQPAASSQDVPSIARQPPSIDVPFNDLLDKTDHLDIWAKTKEEETQVEEEVKRKLSAVAEEVQQACASAEGSSEVRVAQVEEDVKQAVPGKERSNSEVKRQAEEEVKQALALSFSSVGSSFSEARIAQVKEEAESSSEAKLAPVEEEIKQLPGVESSTEVKAKVEKEVTQALSKVESISEVKEAKVEEEVEQSVFASAEGSSQVEAAVQVEERVKKSLFATAESSPEAEAAQVEEGEVKREVLATAEGSSEATGDQAKEDVKQAPSAVELKEAPVEQERLLFQPILDFSVIEDPVVVTTRLRKRDRIRGFFGRALNCAR